MHGVTQALQSSFLQHGSYSRHLFASLAVAANTQPRSSRKRKVRHPTSAHENDLLSLFRDIDTDSQGYLDVHHFRVGSQSCEDSHAEALS